MKKWLTIKDSEVIHIWADPDGKNEVDIPPTYYAESGIPVSGDGKFDGEDMIYVRTEVSPRIAAALKFQKEVEPVLRHIYDILYWDSDKDCFDPNKDWDVDFLEMVADKLVDLYGKPKAGSTELAKLK